MFSNIIYFLVVLLLFNINSPVDTTDMSPAHALGMLILTWGIFAGYCRWGFGSLLSHSGRDREERRISEQYQGLVLRLNVLAILLFALDVYVLHLRYWIRLIPGMKAFSAGEGLLALSLFLFYMATIWYFAWPVYRSAFQAEIERRSFLFSNLRLNIPILFPWFALSLVYDLLSLTPWAGLDSFLNRPEGQILFFAVFLGILMIFLPLFIQSWWGCKAFEPDDRIRELEAFLRERGFRYRGLLRWPIFEGRMMTAGIMGILPRYRYILMTDALMDILTIDELKAVLAHEMGHAKYRHMLFYILFLLAFMILSFGLFDLFFYVLALQPALVKVLDQGSAPAANLFHLVLSLPVLATILLYFRYVMGFFMRHFERQADLYSALTMGSPRQTVSSLEKIALLSGKIRDLPSWHHFSIRERVEYLWRLLREPDLVWRHQRFVALSFLVYLVCMASLVYVLNFSIFKENLTYSFAGRILHQQILEDPGNILLYENLAMVYHKLGRYGEAARAYEKVIEMDPERAVALNNLAWVLVTGPKEELRDRERGLALALRAVSLERSATFLDTLAEAYYANGRYREAVETGEEAARVARENPGYYREQLEKFKEAEKGAR
ncbi:MAG: M48 family metalloprotease, partial [Deltaproteobacteria bacterium]|nr:M48 family metalloprotease [Deltaproteobacteria bacterium]